MLLAALLLALPPAPQAAEDMARPQPWRLLGPLPAATPADDPTAAASLATMRPDELWLPLEDRHLGADGGTVAWAPLDEEGGLVDLDALRAGEHALPRRALLYRNWIAARLLKLTLQVGSDGPLRVWCNGVEVYASADARGVDGAPHRVVLPLEQGLNHLLVETRPGARGWRLRARVEDLSYSEWPEVDRAIDRGVAYLMARQVADGAWPDYAQAYPAAIPALSAYTLIKCGVAVDHPAVQRALAATRRHEPQGTYSLGIVLMALAAAGDPQDRALLERHTRTLGSWARGGLWAYPSGDVDLSNTQYAALGLRAADAAGVGIPAATWKAIAGGVGRCQSRGGYGYRPGSDAGISMTAAGVGTLAICRERLALHGSSSRELDRDIERGITWLGNNNFFATAPPLSAWGYYTVYGIERAGSLAGVAKFGDHDWYREGAEWLLQQQCANGGWYPAGSAADSDLTTCFALLFLRRASALAPAAPATHGPVSGDGARDGDDGPFLASSKGAGPLQLQVSLRPPRRLWLATDSPVYEELERVVYWVRPPGGIWQRLDGDPDAHWAVPFAFAPAGRWAARASGFLAGGESVSSGTLEFTVSEDAGGGGSGGAAAADSAALFADLGGADRAEGARASSTGPRAGALHAADGDLLTGWRCDADDAAPELVVDLARRRAVTRLRIAHAPMLADEVVPRVLPARVEVELDDFRTTVEMPADSAEGLVLLFDEPLRVGRIRLRILSLHRGELGAASVGIGEVLVD